MYVWLLAVAKMDPSPFSLFFSSLKPKRHQSIERLTFWEPLKNPECVHVWMFVCSILKAHKTLCAYAMLYVFITLNDDDLKTVSKKIGEFKNKLQKCLRKNFRSKNFKEDLTQKLIEKFFSRALTHALWVKNFLTNFFSNFRIFLHKLFFATWWISAAAESVFTLVPWENDESLRFHHHQPCLQMFGGGILSHRE